MKRLRGTIHISRALLLGPVMTGLLPWVRDYYVDVNFPLCPGGVGTPQRPFCNIMDAVSAAADGDTIHIAPGTYFENVVLDKELELIGTGGQQVTILDGRAGGSVVRVGAPATLTGLTITNGSGTRIGCSLVPCPNPTDAGGGIYVEPGIGGVVSLIDCSVSGNTADVGGAIWNADVYCQAGVSHGSLILTGCTISDNLATWTSGIEKQGGSLTLTNTSINGNASSRLGAPTLYFASAGCDVAPTSLTLANTSISSNMGSGVWAFSFNGSQLQVSTTHSAVSGNVGEGMYVGEGALTLTDSTIDNNSFSGLSFYSVLGNRAVITNSSVDANGGTGITASALYGSPQITLNNSTVSGNFGAGVRVGDKSPDCCGGYYYSGGEAAIANSTIAANAGGGLIVKGTLAYPSQATLQNSIVWNNGLGSIQLDGTGASCAADYTLLQGGWPGTGNVDADPFFVDPPNSDFRLLPGSPCIDASDNLAVPPSIWTDLDGKRRFIDDPLTEDTGRRGRLWPIVDMGAFEFGTDPPKKVRQR